VIFGLAWRGAGRLWSRLPGWIAGLAFGVLLWALAAVVTGSGATGAWLREAAPVHFAAAHMIYGLAVGVGSGRKRQAQP
jgi:hypothetical protein